MQSEIGLAAGKIWDTLNTKGAMKKTALTKATGLPAEKLNMAIGWLAREDKLTFEKSKTGATIHLK